MHHPQHLPPQSASLSVNPSAFARSADILAGEAAGNDVDSPAVLLNKLACEGSDIVVSPNVGPVLLQHCKAERLNLALPDNRHARPFKAKVYAADAAEQ
jgi:hypothetical protein